MANIKQTDVARDQGSGSSIAKAASSGKLLPGTAAQRLNAYSSNSAAFGIGPHNEQAGLNESNEGSLAGTTGKQGGTSSDNEQLRSRSIASAVTALNDFVQNEKRDLEFSVMEEAGISVVKITNRKSGELIRQIPGDEVVDLARKLNDREPLRLFSALV